ncbi:MAG: flavodoxin domain-containing protein, partial [Bacteroidota bacterium]
MAKELVAGLSRDEMIWLNGYLSGLLSKEGDAIPLPADTSTKTLPIKITLAYGSETGNAQKLATSLAAKAKKSGVQIKLVGLDQYKFENLVNEEWFFVVISTQGEGEPPIGAKNFYDYLFTEALAFPKMNYAVLGLGDTSYPLFCKTGEDVDAQLKKAGAKQLLQLQ